MRHSGRSKAQTRLLQHSGDVATTDAQAHLPSHHQKAGTAAAAAAVLPPIVTPGGVGSGTTGAVRRLWAQLTETAGASYQAHSPHWLWTPMRRRRYWRCGGGQAPPPVLQSRRRHPHLLLLLLLPHDTVCSVRRRLRAPASRGALPPPLEEEARHRSKGGQVEQEGVAVGSPFPSPLPVPAHLLQRLLSGHWAVPSRPPLEQAAVAGAHLSSPLRVRVLGRTREASHPSRASSSLC